MDEDRGLQPSGADGEDSGRKPEGGLLPSLIDIFIDPQKVFERIDAGLEWWKAYIAVSVVTVVIAYLNMPVQKQLMLVSERMSGEQAQAAVEQMERFGFIGLIAAPAGVLLIWLILAALVNVTVNLVSGKSEYKKVLSLIGFTSLIGVLEQIIQLVVIRLKGIESIESVSDTRIPLGLAALFPGSEGAARALMDSLSVFQIWYLIVFTLGVSAIFRISRAKAAVPAALMWLIGFAFLWLGGSFGGR